MVNIYWMGNADMSDGSCPTSGTQHASPLIVDININKQFSSCPIMSHKLTTGFTITSGSQSKMKRAMPSSMSASIQSCKAGGITSRYASHAAGRLLQDLLLHELTRYCVTSYGDAYRLRIVRGRLETRECFTCSLSSQSSRIGLHSSDINMLMCRKPPSADDQSPAFIAGRLSHNSILGQVTSCNVADPELKLWRTVEPFKNT